MAWPDGWRAAIRALSREQADPRPSRHCYHGTGLVITSLETVE